MLENAIKLGVFVEQQKSSTAAKIGAATGIAGTALAGHAALKAGEASRKASRNTTDIEFLDRMRQGGRASMFDRLARNTDF